MHGTKEKLGEVLNKIGIKEKLKAHNYLKFIICDILEQENCQTLTKSLYDRVAKMSNKTNWSVERNIRYGIEVGFEKGNYNLLVEIFGNNISERNGKVSNFRFIKILWEWLKKQEKMA